MIRKIPELASDNSDATVWIGFRISNLFPCVFCFLNESFIFYRIQFKIFNLKVIFLLDDDGLIGMELFDGLGI